APQIPQPPTTTTTTTSSSSLCYLRADTCFCWPRSSCVSNHHLLLQFPSSCTSPGFHIIHGETSQRGDLKRSAAEEWPSAAFDDTSHVATNGGVIHADPYHTTPVGL
ncbi:hypothetical protein JOB18_042348, partial [Solea senegalensis]